MKSRKVCVTGADHGLGFALAEGFLSRGFDVFAGRYQKESLGLERLSAKYPGHLIPVDMDISDSAAVQRAADYISWETDHIDILINNAAILGDIHKTVEDTLDFAEMVRVYEVNALGSLRTANALLPLIKNGLQKLIVNISSEAGSIENSYRTAWFGYCMSKSALNMQSTIIHNQIRAWGGQVMAIEPGWMQTFMSGHKNYDATYTPEQSAERIIALILRHKDYLGDKAVFINNLGDKMNW
jgi:NAD(P)-dependent dehydrogenase (short-subunit alcohol dehydrogenase family)